ncbi:hypothetical protein D3C85_1499630 [compost metagenome]
MVGVADKRQVRRRGVHGAGVRAERVDRNDGVSDVLRRQLHARTAVEDNQKVRSRNVLLDGPVIEPDIVWK